MNVISKFFLSVRMQPESNDLPGYDVRRRLRLVLPNEPITPHRR